MQAARGTPVATGSRARLRLLFAAVALAAYTLDQVTKVVAVDRLDGRPDVQVVGDLLQLNLVRNPGAAFSTGTGFTPVISVVAIVAALAVLWYSRRLGSRLWAIGLGFLLAGVVGNLTDRMLREPGPFRGHVIDFLMLPNWPVFNVADICINVAAGLIILQALRGIGLDGTRESRSDDADADADAEPDAEPEAGPEAESTEETSVEERAE